MSIAAIGGTGTVGSEVVRRLSDRGAPVRVLTRSPDEREGPDGVEYVAGDLEEKETLSPFMDGAETLYLLTPLHPDERELGRRAVEAAVEADVGYVVFHTVHRVHEIPEAPHFHSKIEIQKDLDDSGIPHALVMPNNYFQNDLWFREPIVEHGVYPQPIGSAGLSRVDVGDIAEITVNALLDRSHAGSEIPAVGPDVLTAEACADILSRHLGRDVAYAGSDLDAWAQQAREMLPDWMVEDFRIMYAHFQTRGLAATPRELELQAEVLGREPRSYDDFAAELAERWG